MVVIPPLYYLHAARRTLPRSPGVTNIEVYVSLIDFIITFVLVLVMN